jgi:hypothetical protein
MITLFVYRSHLVAEDSDSPLKESPAGCEREPLPSRLATRVQGSRCERHVRISYSVESLLTSSDDSLLFPIQSPTGPICEGPVGAHKTGIPRASNIPTMGETYWPTSCSNVRGEHFHASSIWGLHSLGKDP